MNRNISCLVAISTWLLFLKKILINTENIMDSRTLSLIDND